MGNAVDVESRSYRLESGSGSDITSIVIKKKTTVHILCKWPIYADRHFWAECRILHLHFAAPG